MRWPWIAALLLALPIPARAAADPVFSPTGPDAALAFAASAAASQQARATILESGSTFLLTLATSQSA